MKVKTIKETMDIDLTKFKIKLYDSAVDNLFNLNFLHSDGTDPLKSHEFYKNHIIGNNPYDETIFVIKYKDNCVGYFSIALVDFDGIKSSLIPKSERKTSPISSLMISSMGIDKNYRCYGIGKYILYYTAGLAQEINKYRSCKILIFKTTLSLAEKIYSPKYGFRYQHFKGKLVWIYKRIC